MAQHDITEQIATLRDAGWTDERIDALHSLVDVSMGRALNVSALAAVNVAAQQATAIQWARLTDGTWGLRGRCLTTGATVTVTKRGASAVDQDRSRKANPYYYRKWCSTPDKHPGDDPTLTLKDWPPVERNPIGSQP